MNPELQKEIATWLASVREGANFAIEQAPLVVRDKVAYGRITETLDVVFFAAATITALWLMRWCWRKAQNIRGYDDGLLYAAVGTCGALSLILGLLTWAHLTDVVRVWFAPRLYVVEWLASLIK